VSIHNTMKRVKVKTSKKQIADDSVVHMFNQMLGTEDADITIIIPKYELVKSKVKSLSKILLAATEDVIRKSFPDEKNGCDEILVYIESLNDIDFIATPPLHSQITPDAALEINKSYKLIKDNNDIKMMVLIYKNLICYSDRLSTGADFDDSFIARIPGYEFKPLPFSELNIKRMWFSPNITDRIKKYMFTVMSIILGISKDIYKTLTSPDIDVKKFSQGIINSIALVKKKIPRCDKAFKKIEQSVELLVGNFDGYYKDFIQSQNPSTIIESFVIDVSNSGGADAQTTRQFGQIINYYKKATHGKIKDPKIKEIFNLLNSRFDSMESNYTSQNESTTVDETESDKSFSPVISDEQKTADDKVLKKLIAGKISKLEEETTV
jgi:hypothetical protein